MGAAVDGRAARGRRLAPLLLGLALLAGTGCTGPGLEPPWSDDDAEGSARSDGNGAILPSGPNTATGGSGSGFGNSMGGAAGSAAPPTAGSGGSGSSATPPGTGAAGSGAVQPPPATTLDPSTSVDAGTAMVPGEDMAGAGAGGALSGIDFVPDCDTEAPLALQSVEACRYPLPEDAALELASLQVAALDGSDAALLDRGQSALGCLFGSDYYVDESASPAVIVLCSDACSALPATAQLVAIDGCPPAP